MAYPDKINNLVAVTGDQTLAAGGHAARHNDVKEALEEVKGALGGGDPVVAQSASTTPLVLKGASGQTANLLTVEDSAGTDLVVVDSAGKVGVGTDNPGTNGLDIYKASGQSGLSISSGSNTTEIVQLGSVLYLSNSATPSGVEVWLNGSNRFGVNASGAVLIGTTTAGSAGAGDLVVNGGVFLGGTAAANELDDYEEGTWTPTVTNGITSPVYDTTNTTGIYTKVGDLIHVNFRVKLTGGTAVGSDLEFGGLPFTSQSTNVYRILGFGYFGSGAGNDFVTLTNLGSLSAINKVRKSDGSIVLGSAATNTMDFYGSFTYKN